MIGHIEPKRTPTRSRRSLRHAYGTQGRLRRTTKPLGGIQEATYWSEGMTWAVKSPSETVVSSAYDAAGQPATVAGVGVTIRTRSLTVRGELATETTSGCGTERYSTCSRARCRGDRRVPQCNAYRFALVEAVTVRQLPDEGEPRGLRGKRERNRTRSRFDDLVAFLMACPLRSSADAIRVAKPGSIDRSNTCLLHGS